MSQSKRQSALEVVFGTAIGYIASVTAQVLVFPLYGINVSLLDNMSLVLMFTVISVIRGYWVRRLFNWIGRERKHPEPELAAKPWYHCAKCQDTRWVHVPGKDEQVTCECSAPQFPNRPNR